MPNSITSLPTRLLCLLVLSQGPGAQTPQAALSGGDPVLGSGTFRSASELRVDRAGNWFALVETDLLAPPDQPLNDGLLLRNGFTALREGSPIFNPLGSEIESIDIFEVDSDGGYFLALTLRGDVQAEINDAGLFYDSRLLVRRGSPVPFPEYPAGTNWLEFLGLYSPGEREALVLLGIDDPEVFGDVNLALARLRVDTEGELLEAELLAKDGDQLAGVQRPIRTLGVGPHAVAADASGNVLFRLFQTGGQAGDGVIALNQTAIARESTFSTVEGRRYSDLSGSSLHMNATGELVFTAVLDAPETESGSSDEVIVRGRVLSDSEVELTTFVQKGAVIPAFSPFALTAVAEGPVFLSEGGDLFWHARTNDPVTGTNEAYLRNGEILLQKGVSRVDNIRVANLRSGPEAFAISPDGRFLFAEVVLDGPGESLVYMDLGRLAPFEPCAPAAARLRVTQGNPLAGQTLSFRLEGGQGPGILPYLLFSSQRLGPAGGCGVDLGFGEVLVRPPITHIAAGTPLDGTTSVIQVTLPNDSVLVGSTWYLQGLFVDALELQPGPDRLLTNGIAMTIGAP